jgi:hypothetical protein
VQFNCVKKLHEKLNVLRHSGGLPSGFFSFFCQFCVSCACDIMVLSGKLRKLWCSPSELCSSLWKMTWKDSSEACAIASQNCAVYSVFPSGMMSHSKIAQFNWECIGCCTCWLRIPNILYSLICHMYNLWLEFFLVWMMWCPVVTLL